MEVVGHGFVGGGCGSIGSGRVGVWLRCNVVIVVLVLVVIGGWLLWRLVAAVVVP